MLDALADYLPPGILDEIKKLPPSLLGRLEEIRLRAGKPVLLTADADKVFLGKPRIIATRADISEVLSALTGHSIYSRAESILSGYFSVKGGIRVGISGNFLYEGGQLANINQYTSLNIRIPRAIRGLVRPIARYVSRNCTVLSLLIISPPGHGKTTLLRDIVRSVASGEDFKAQNCCIIDERSEIAGMYNEDQMFDVGEMCDVLNGAKKPDGIRMAIRSMAPDVIATDEIGDAADMRALMEARNAGVTIIATAHAENLEHLRGRLLFAKMMDEKLFSRYVLLGSSQGRGTVEGIYNEHFVNIYSKDTGAGNENSAMRGYFDLYISNRSEHL
ncbi:MAG: stage III sporulation protein AA [Eubacteriales bacterium]